MKMSNDKGNEIVICRACMNECMEYKNIHRGELIQGELRTIATMLSDCTNLQFFKEEDNFLPDNLCIDCIEKLIKLYVFKQMVIASDETLRCQNRALNTKNEQLYEWHESYKMEIDIEPSNVEMQSIYHEQGKNLEVGFIKKEVDYNRDINGESLSSAQCSGTASEDEDELQNVSTNKVDIKKVPAVVNNNKTKKINKHKKNKETKICPPVSPVDLQCKVCGKQLCSNKTFKSHMQLHSDTKPPHTCIICGKSYIQRTSLRTHLYTHANVKPFKCKICGKQLTQRSGYKKHMLTHTGEKPHSCDVCGRKFSASSTLITHRRIHTGEKPYDCHLCEKRFAASSALKRHLLVHTKQYNCEICNKSFLKKKKLVAHRKKMHANADDK